MAGDPKITMDPRYGGGQGPALRALNRPKRFYDCVAVMLDKGGDSGYWMRLLGNENFPHRRVGSLVVTPDAVSYGETCSPVPKPRSSRGMLMLMARGKDRAFRDYAWAATSDEIEDLIVRPVNLSPHGAFASVEIQARGQRVHIGVGAGRPHIQHCIAALRHLAGRELDVYSASDGTPRTDGIYAFAAHERRTPFQAYYFTGSEAALLGLSNPAKDVRDLRFGDWEVIENRCHTEGDHFIIENEDPNLYRHVFIRADNQLVVQAEISRSNVTDYGEAGFEYQFVPFSELTDNWGVPTVPGPLPGPDWPAVLTRSGDIEAAELGAPKARIKE